MSENKTITIKFDLWSILKLVLGILLIVVLYWIRDVLLIFFLAILLALILDPVANFFQKIGVPRTLGTIFIYLFIVMILLGVIIPVIPLITREVGFLAEQLPKHYSRYLSILEGSESGWAQIGRVFFKNWLGEMKLSSGGIFDLLSSTFGVVVVTASVLLIAFYATSQKLVVVKMFKNIIPDKYEKYALKFLLSIREKIGSWGRGLFLQCIMVGILTYAGLLILGVDNALVLAVFNGAMEVVPYIGAWIAAIPAVLLVLLVSPTKAIIVAIFYLVIQQIQQSLISPLIMKKAVGLNPLFVIMALLIGGKLMGFVGALLAIPVTNILVILFQEYSLFRKEEKAMFPGNLPRIECEELNTNKQDK